MTVSFTNGQVVVKPNDGGALATRQGKRIGEQKALKYQDYVTRYKTIGKDE